MFLFYLFMLQCDIIFKQIRYSINDPAFNELIDLRYNLLRKPLGLNFETGELEAEANDIHIAGYLNSKLSACLVLSPISKSIYKMRQVCVSIEYQNKGIGTKLIQFAERTCTNLNADSIVLNARETALNLYLKNGYQINSDMFIELGIPHYKMTKRLHCIVHGNQVSVIGHHSNTSRFLKDLRIDSNLGEYTLDNKYYKAILSLKTTEIDDFEPNSENVALILVFESVIIF